MAKVAINGLGRIGRATLKIILDRSNLDLVAVNDLVPADNLAYLLRYDTVYGRYHRGVEPREDALVVDGRPIALFHEQDPAALPWGPLGVELAFECTGAFTNEEGLKKHLQAGARLAILSAPAKTETVATVVYGVNEPGQSERHISCASCTTNCIAPVVEVLDRRIGVELATMTTVHAYTSSQSLVDGPGKKFRRGRAGAANIVPTSTGAAVATTRTVPSLRDRFDGAALRVPVPTGSIADVVCLARRDTGVEEINRVFREEAASQRYRDVLGISEDNLVSSDIIGDSRASVVDLTMTQVVGKRLVKVMSWYDNEWGYSCQMVRQAQAMLGVSPGPDEAAKGFTAPPGRPGAG